MNTINTSIYRILAKAIDCAAALVVLSNQNL